jgi:hypothetical protein
VAAIAGETQTFSPLLSRERTHIGRRTRLIGELEGIESVEAGGDFHQVDSTDATGKLLVDSPTD